MEAITVSAGKRVLKIALLKTVQTMPKKEDHAQLSGLSLPRRIYSRSSWLWSYMFTYLTEQLKEIVTDYLPILILLCELVQVSSLSSVFLA